MKKLLLTGFEPFSTHQSNPTQDLVLSLNNKIINDYLIKVTVLPVVYEQSIRIMEKLIEEVNPDVIISLGLTAERSEITPELVALNFQHSNIPDNNGVIKQYSKIDEGESAYYSTLPVAKMIEELIKNGHPAKLSTTAGTYVCNTVMYTSLKKIQLDNRHTRSGFIHIPNTLSLENLQNAITTCINQL